MRVDTRILSAAMVAAIFFTLAAPRLEAATTTRVSIATDLIQGNQNSIYNSISADGRYVAFESAASTLVELDTNGVSDIFVHDRATGQTTRVSLATGGVEADGASSSPAISADGRYVAFESLASNLAPNDTNGLRDIFVHDRNTGQTSLVSKVLGGGAGNGPSLNPSISSDGRYTAFSSTATDLVAGDTNGKGDIFIHDRDSDQTIIVSLATGGAQADGNSSTPSISANGRKVAFASDATDLAPLDTNNDTDVFLRDLDAATTSRVSIASDGSQASGYSGGPCISPDGGVVGFRSTAADLVPGDTNSTSDAFVHDLDGGITTRVSLATEGTEGNNQSYSPALSGDGRIAVFSSAASNLVPDDDNGDWDVFMHDRQTGRTWRVSLAWDGSQASGNSFGQSVSYDGRQAAFYSYAANLVQGDTNAKTDVFVRDSRAAAFGFLEMLLLN